MEVQEIIDQLELVAHPYLQEGYDNTGLITGNPSWECSGALCTLDATLKVVDEAIHKKCNLIVTHHPIIFSGLKKINGFNYVEKAVIAAIKNDIAIFAIHTNLDNIMSGVNGIIADKLGLFNRQILSPKQSTVKKLFTFVPVEYADQVRDAIFLAGGGYIGNYSECSFNVDGTGTFTGSEGSNPFVGEVGRRHHERETKIEIIFPSWLQSAVVRAMKAAHPYEEPAYDVIDLSNTNPMIGSGLVGEFNVPMGELEFLAFLKKQFQLSVVRHTALRDGRIRKVALCGGAGSFLVSKALSTGAEAFVTADLKYHEFFDANDRMLLCDIGHYESEQFTIELLANILQEKFPTFAVLKSGTRTNPVYYYF